MIDFDAIERALKARKEFEPRYMQLKYKLDEDDIIETANEWDKRYFKQLTYPEQIKPITSKKLYGLRADIAIVDEWDTIIGKHIEEVRRNEAMKDNILVVIGEKDGYKAYRPEGITFEPASPTDWKKPFDRYHIDVKLSPSSERYWTMDALRRACAEPKKIIFNGPATIVFWKDGTKTVVKAENEAFDPEKGIAMAYLKKFLGNKGNYFNTIKKAIKMAECVE